MLKLSKKQYKKLLLEFLGNPHTEPLKVHIDFENELLYYLCPTSNFIWYLEGSLTSLIKDSGWERLPKSLLKQADKVILQDKHFVVLPVEIEDVLAPQPTLSLFDGISAGRLDESPRLAVCALITGPSSNTLPMSFLSVSRKDDPTDFGLPGGKVDKGEDILDALAREVFEETGYTLKEEVLELYRNIDDDGYEVVTFLARIDWSIPKANVSEEETGVLAWKSADALTKGSFGDYNAALFKSLGYSRG